MKINLTKLTVLASFAINALTVTANEIVIKDVKKSMKIGKDVTIYEDKTGKLKLEDILKQTDEFYPSKSQMFHSGYTYSTYWFRAEIKNETDNKKFVFDGLCDSFGIPTLYYSINNEGFVEAKKTDKNIFKINLAKSDKATLLLKIEGTGSFSRLKLSILPKELYKIQEKGGFNFSLAIHILDIIFGIISVFIFFMFRQKLQLYFLIYATFVLLITILIKYKFDLTSFLANYTSNSEKLIIFAFGVIRVLCALYLIKFIKEILGLKKLKYFNYCAYFLLTVMALSYVFNIIGILNFQIVIITKNMVYLLLSILYLVTSILWIRRNNIAKYLVIAFIFNFIPNGLLTLELFTKTILLPMTINAINFWLINLSDLFLILIAYFLMKSNELRAQQVLVEGTNNLITALGFAPDTKKVLSYLLESFKKSVNYDKAYVFMLKEDNYELASTVPDDIDPDEVNYFTKVLGNNKWEKEEIIDELSKYSKRKDGNIIWQGTSPKEAESVLILPLKYMDNYLGVVLLTSKYKCMYTNESINYGKDLSQKIAMVTDSFNKMNQEIEVERSIRKFLALSGEEIKVPLNITRYFINRVSAEYEELHKGDIKEELKENIIEAQEATKCTLDMLRLTMAISGEDAKEEFKMAEVNKTVHGIRELCKEQGIKLIEELQIPEDRMLYGPKYGITISMDELLMNAVQAFEEHDMKGVEKEIRVKIEEKGKQLHVEIMDNGKGIKREYQRKVFGMFTYNKKTGSGRGLMYVKAVIEGLKGHVELESEEGKFTKISFTVDVLKRNKDENEGDAN